LEAGGFDEDYFAYQEDVDLGFRLRLRGLRCYLVPTAIVYHVGAGSSGLRSSFSIYYGHRNLVWTYFKNMLCWFWLYLPSSLHLEPPVDYLFALRRRARRRMRSSTLCEAALQREAHFGAGGTPD
jgi:GT2 family glycosyltransferase